ncbi:calcium channel protein [Rhizina undulata]
MSGSNSKRPPSSEPIPLQDLSRPPEDHDLFADPGHSTSFGRSRSLHSLGAELGRRLSSHRSRRSYDRVPDEGHHSRPPPIPQLPDLQVPRFDNDEGATLPSIFEFREGFREALGDGSRGGSRGSWLPPRNLEEPLSPWVAGEDEPLPGTFPSFEISQDDHDDMMPLTDPANLQPISGFDPFGSDAITPHASGQGVRFAPGSSLGEDLHIAEEGMSTSMSTGVGSGTRSRSGSFVKMPPSRSGSLTKIRSLSPGASPVRRVSVAVQNMSQRVVNLSNDPGAVEQSIRRKSSTRSIRSAHRKNRLSLPEIEINSYEDNDGSEAEKPTTPLKRARRPDPFWHLQANPLKGNSLRIFSPTHPLRVFLCDVLVHPATEPLILVLILIQTILLTIDAAPNVFDDPRDVAWGTSKIDYAMLAIFGVYTLEIAARCIVSGVFMNPKQSIGNEGRVRGSLRRRIMEKGNRLLSPKRQESVRAPSPTRIDQPPSLLRSITTLHLDGAPDSAKAQARARLARRAFLRHSFNRLDFLAVCSYWISLALTLTEIESEKHLYVFRMMSCLRILRLLGITSGTSVILRSLKKAAPLLANVSLLIGFFWLVFAIIGVQSFKSSFRRSCVWVDPAGVQQNYTQFLQFCGGYLNATTGLAEPYLFNDGTPSSTTPKGYICPANSLCIMGENPYGGTVSFDNIVQSLELVFVIMSTNTFANLLYYMADSDYLAAALCKIVILAFWLSNLLIAVITSSFQVIREESKISAFAAEEVDSISIKDEDNGRPKISNLKKIYDKTYYLWILIIAFGLFASAFRSSSMSPKTHIITQNIELGTTIALMFEIILRFACDWRQFHRKRRNWFDLFLAVITSVMQIPVVRESGRVYEILTFFQILRIYRVVWAIPVIRNLMGKVLGNVVGLSNLIFFLLLLTFLCSIFAVQILRGDLAADINGNTTQAPFFNIFNAFLGMYQVFSSEDWTTILFNVTQSQQPYNTAWISAIFFIGWFILGNFIVLNMFIAVIQENFDVSEDEKRFWQVRSFLQNKDYGAPSQGVSISSLFKRRREKTKEPHSKQAVFEMLTQKAVVESFLDEGGENKRPVSRAVPMAAATAVSHLQAEEEKKQGFFHRTTERIIKAFKEKEQNPFYSFGSRSFENLAPTARAQEIVTEQERRKKAQREYLRKYPNYNVSLYLFKPSNPVRRFCQCVVGPSRGSVRYEGLQPYGPISGAFSIIVYCAVVAMVVIACITTPMYQKKYYETHGNSSLNWFTLTDVAFVVLFTLESIMKIIADGLIWAPNAYLRGSWGIIDCIVLITLWTSVITSLRNQDEIARAVGAFKALRALRLLNISGSAQDTFHSVVVLGGRKILGAAFVSLSLIIPFAIYGVNLFSGLMVSCNDESNVVYLSDCVNEYASSPYNWNVLAPRAATNPFFNFDSFPSSLFILFQIVSQEGWIAVMFSAESIVGNGMQPQPFASQAYALFFVAFNLLGSVFVLTLFVSVFMRNYTEQTGVAFLTSDQRSWLELRKLLRQVRASKRPNGNPDSKWRTWCYNRATHKHGWWQRGVTLVLILHCGLLLLEYHPAPQWLDRTRDWIFLAFTLVFLINLAVRVIGLTWANFLKSRWDWYALVTVSGTFVTTILLLAGYVDTAFVQLQKLFLVSLLMLLIPRNNDLDHLFKTAASSLTAIGSLMATWFVLFLVYAIAFTQTFGLTKIGPNGGDNINFRTVPKALVLLFRMTCGEGWNQIMSDYEVTEPLCVHGPTFFESDCGSSGYARALFVSWNILSTYIFLSMFISHIYESFSYVYQRSGGSSAVSRMEIRKFKAAWSKFDTEGTGYISKEKFARFLGHLSGVFAMRIYEEPFTVPSILAEVRVDPAKGKGVSGRVFDGIDLDALDRRIAAIPVTKIRRQRHIFTLFYEECLVSADKEYGVSFTSVLLILAHYKIINDNKSLKLEEYLRRRYRLQRVEEQVQRNIVTNFFLRLYWHKRFKDYRRARGLSTISSPLPAGLVPQIFVNDANVRTRTMNAPNVPHILVDDGEVPPDSKVAPVPQILLNEGPTTPHRQHPPPLDLGISIFDVQPTFGASFSSAPQFRGADPFGPSSPFSLDESPSVLRHRTGHKTPPDISPAMSPNMSPVASPSASGPGWHGRGGAGSPTSGSPTNSIRLREISDVRLDNVLEALGSSEWGDEIRSYIESRSRAGSPAGSRTSRKE